MSMPGIPPSLGELIREQRRLSELPMRQLATMVGISNPYLSQIENGLRAPSEQVLNLIAESLGVPVSDLAGEPETDLSEDDTRAMIRRDGRLSAAQRRALVEVYDSMVAAHSARRRDRAGTSP